MFRHLCTGDDLPAIIVANQVKGILKVFQYRKIDPASIRTREKDQLHFRY